MAGALDTLRGDVVRGTRAPVRPLVSGMFAAFAVSLPLTVALSVATPLPLALTSMATGATHALATFAVAGRAVRRAEAAAGDEEESQR